MFRPYPSVKTLLLPFDTSVVDRIFLTMDCQQVEFSFDHGDGLCTFLTTSDKRLSTDVELLNVEGLSADLSQLLCQPDLCDIRFLIGPHKVPVYAVSSILAARSSFFRKLFNTKSTCTTLPANAEDVVRKKNPLSAIAKVFKRKSRTLNVKIEEKVREESWQVELPDVEEGVFRSVLDYIYSGNVLVNVYNVVGVMKAAHEYALPELCAACFIYAKRNITHTSALPLLSATCTYGQLSLNERLQGIILKYIAENAETILTQTAFDYLSRQEVDLIFRQYNIQASEETKLEAILRWSHKFSGDAGYMYLRKTLKLFIRRVNMLKISKSTLQNVIKPLCLFPDEVIPKKAV
ncbi:serine-enriched protein-like [Liolophura sinensis]|uniref:serine-enriched protein-like n=1 Tax=Liolophura sinensis TaxID=3198878 RepID=UPI00315914CD